MKTFSFSTSRVLFEHPLTFAAQGELWVKMLLCERHVIKNCCGYFLANFFENLGYFLFQHLVTLPCQGQGVRVAFN